MLGCPPTILIMLKPAISAACKWRSSFCSDLQRHLKTLLILNGQTLSDNASHLVKLECPPWNLSATAAIHLQYEPSFLFRKFGICPIEQGLNYSHKPLILGYTKNCTKAITLVCWRRANGPFSDNTETVSGTILSRSYGAHAMPHLLSESHLVLAI
jgi:hypothetical protein